MGSCYAGNHIAGHYMQHVTLRNHNKILTDIRHCSRPSKGFFFKQANCYFYYFQPSKTGIIMDLFTN